MKHFSLLLLALITSLTQLFAQGPPTRVPDVDSPDPGTAWYYYENHGQIIDKAQVIRNDIRYYTTHPGVKLYLGDDTISFTGSSRTILGDTLAIDTSFRLDMQFFCPQRDMNQPCPNTIATYIPSTDSLNYYLPHCGTAGIEGVPGFGGVVYQDAFPSTDVHFFSNPGGPLTYFVFHPTADTGAFALLFDGHDSIETVASYLHAYIGQHDIWFPDGVAYQIDNSGNILPLSWIPTWYKVNNDMVKMQFGSYNPAFDLVIRTGHVGAKTAAFGMDNHIWSTYYGDDGSEAFPDPIHNWNTDGTPIIKSVLAGTPATPFVYHAMTTNSDSFDINTGSVWKASSGLDSTFGGAYDCIISSFHGVTGVRQWATYYGGSGYEEVGALAVIDRPLVNNNSIGNLLVGGRTKSADLPFGLFWYTTLPWHKATNSSNTGSFIASISASLGRLKYATYFGGGAHCYLDGLVWDESKKEIVFNGYINGNWALKDEVGLTPTPGHDTISFRDGGRYYQTTNTDNTSAFIGSFDTTRNLVWFTLIGGDSLDVINLVVPDKSGGLYALGNTRSRYANNTVVSKAPLTAPVGPSLTLPFVKPTNSSYCQTDMHWRRGFLLHFDTNRAIDWGTLYGGGNDNEYLGLAVNANDDVYISGVASNANTFNSNQADNLSGLHRLPAYDATGTSYMQGYGSSSGGNNIGPDAVIARFNSAHELRWSTLFGQWGYERAPVRLAIDQSNHVYMAGNNEVDTFVTGPSGIPIYNVPGRYQQDSNASAPYASTGNTQKETQDGWIVQFNPSNQPVWSTMYGGVFPGFHPVSIQTLTTSFRDAREKITSIDVAPNNGVTNLYTTGITKNPKTTMAHSNGAARIPAAGSITTTYYDSSHAGNWDCFIGMFEISPSPVAVPRVANRRPVNSLTVAPNPSHNRFTVNFINESGIGKAPMAVTNALGQVLLSANITVVRGENKFMVDLDKQPAGVYFLQVAGSEGVRMVKY